MLLQRSIIQTPEKVHQCEANARWALSGRNGSWKLYSVRAPPHQTRSAQFINGVIGAERARQNYVSG